MLGMPFCLQRFGNHSPCSPGNALRARNQLGEGSPSHRGCTSGAVGKVGEFPVPFLNAAGARQWGTVTVCSCVKENNPSHVPGMPQAMRDLCPTRPTCCPAPALTRWCGSQRQGGKAPPRGCCQLLCGRCGPKWGMGRCRCQVVRGKAKFPSALQGPAGCYKHLQVCLCKLEASASEYQQHILNE